MRETITGGPGSLPQFQPDYLIVWDFSDKDAPCVNLVKLERDGAKVVAQVLGRSYQSSGVISLRQAIEAYEEEKRREKKRAEEWKELLKKPHQKHSIRGRGF